MPENTFFQTLDSNPYFQSLPPFIQESIRQSSPEIRSESDLRQCAEKLMQKQ